MTKVPSMCLITGRSLRQGTLGKAITMCPFQHMCLQLQRRGRSCSRSILQDLIAHNHRCLQAVTLVSSEFPDTLETPEIVETTEVTELMKIQETSEETLDIMRTLDTGEIPGGDNGSRVTRHPKSTWRQNTERAMIDLAKNSCRSLKELY